MLFRPINVWAKMAGRIKRASSSNVQGRDPGSRARYPRRRASPCDHPGRRTILSHMEFLNFLIIIWAAWLVWRRPDKERLAFGLLILSCIVMAVLFLIGTHTSLIPRVNL